MRVAINDRHSAISNQHSALSIQQMNCGKGDKAKTFMD